jgi:hypothetical protein
MAVPGSSGRVTPGPDYPGRGGGLWLRMIFPAGLAWQLTCGVALNRASVARWHRAGTLFHSGTKAGSGEERSSGAKGGAIPGGGCPAAHSRRSTGVTH